MEGIRTVPLGPTPVSANELQDMYVQLQSETLPLAVKGITGERQHERVVTVQTVAGPLGEREVPESQVVAAWHSPQPLPEARIESFKELVLSVYPQDFADRHHTGYRYVVRANGLLPHRGFKNAAELDSWAAEHNLELPVLAEELPESNFISIKGQYHRATHVTTITFEAIDGIRTRAWDNGSITAAQCVTDMSNGEVTVHVVGPNCTAREVFDRLLWPQRGEHTVFYAPGDRTIYDVAVWQDGVGPIGRFGGETLAQVRERYPRTIMATISEATDATIQATRTPVREIAQEWFDRALDDLPPQEWIRTAQTESFKFMEHIAGPVTGIYVRCEDRYFRLDDVCTLKHDQIVERVRSSGLLEQPRPEFEADELPAPRMR